MGVTKCDRSRQERTTVLNWTALAAERYIARRRIVSHRRRVRKRRMTMDHGLAGIPLPVAIGIDEYDPPRRPRTGIDWRQRYTSPATHPFSAGELDCVQEVRCIGCDANASADAGEAGGADAGQNRDDRDCHHHLHYTETGSEVAK